MYLSPWPWAASALMPATLHSNRNMINDACVLYGFGLGLPCFVLALSRLSSFGWLGGALLRRGSSHIVLWSSVRFALELVVAVRTGFAYTCETFQRAAHRTRKLSLRLCTIRAVDIHVESDMAAAGCTCDCCGACAHCFAMGGHKISAPFCSKLRQLHGNGNSVYVGTPSYEPSFAEPAPATGRAKTIIK